MTGPVPKSGGGFACLDWSREERCGRPEVIFCPGKTPEQVARIALALSERNPLVLGTRANVEQAKAAQEVLPEMRYDEASRCLLWGQSASLREGWRVAVVAAGTADWPVQAEARVTLEAYGWEVLSVTDVGVAGLHRLLERIDEIRACEVIIVVAGMEGALASVVAGLVSRPIIAVPTSVGYGASLGGVSALLTMLNSCASGVTVVNIDNGFGAAVAADSILRLAAGLGSANSGGLGSSLRSREKREEIE